MDITAVRAFFMWCTIINTGLLFLTSLVCIFFSDFSYKMNSKWFPISRPAFDAVFLSFIALYKLFVIAFNFVPWMALLIIG